MYKLEEIRRSSSESVCKTISNPIRIMDYLELKEALLGIGLIFYFGIIFTSPLLLTILLFLLWGVWPPIRSQFERGIIVQKLYRHLGLKFPGMIRVPKDGRFSA